MVQRLRRCKLDGPLLSLKNFGGPESGALTSADDANSISVVSSASGVDRGVQ